MKESELVRQIHMAGGRIAVVGGWVRDSLRGVEPKDKDYVISGVGEDEFISLFPEAQKVGRSFPVFLLRVNGEASEIAFARTERKTGKGYRGFCVQSSIDVTIEDDLSRRDTTINAMALELFEDGATPQLINLFSGEADVERGIIRAVSSCFTEDPVRALRAARQAAEFGYDIEPNTIRYMHLCREELEGEPQERIFAELSRALAAPRPSVFFRSLLSADLLDLIFPEIFALIGKTQPKAFHPEGDAFEHTMATVDAVASRTENLVVRFAALVHDIGKGVTPEDLLPHHYGHEVKGLAVLEKWDSRMGFPKLWRRVADFVIAEHMRAPRLKKAGKIVDFLISLSKLPVPARDVLQIFLVDHGDLPYYLEQYEALIGKMLSVNGSDAPENLQGQEIGAWIRAQRTRCLQEARKDWSD